MNASSATIYRHTLGAAWDESGTDFTPTPAVHDEFSLEVIHAWENAFNTATTPRTRKIALRTTLVLGHARNSVFPVLCRLARFGLGGRMGSGNQFVSWLHQADFCRALEWLIGHDNISGPVNLATPNPLPNRDMMRLFRELVGTPIGLPATEWMLEIGAFSAHRDGAYPQEPSCSTRQIADERLQVSISRDARRVKRLSSAPSSRLRREQNGSPVRGDKAGG